ncbi:MAG: signal recognition particle-docking protein FtsY [Treponema sp.]|jgi:fused signal recognition particle receptor|nr:signal recognition particle-docking protein FtsY [Treponema sp.]
MNGFAERIFNFFKGGKTLSEDVFEDLTDLLVEGDFGAQGAYQVSDRLREACKKEHVEDGEGARKILVRLLEEILSGADTSPVNAPPGSAPCRFFLSDSSLNIILLLGVNGVGKTTSAAKLASVCLAQNKKPILAAGDTFRAAAIDQIKIHGERLGVRVVAHQQGGDPAAVIYDAIDAARSGGADVIIADTAGRMHTKAALVEELKKIDRIVESRAKGAAYFRYLVLDATTGRNALAQAEIFHQAVKLDGVILTKYDSSAKGGVVFSLAEDLGIPVVFLCNGEKYGDIIPFDAAKYARGFAGLA